MMSNTISNGLSFGSHFDSKTFSYIDERQGEKGNGVDGWECENEKGEKNKIQEFRMIKKKFFFPGKCSLSIMAIKSIFAQFY